MSDEREIKGTDRCRDCRGELISRGQTEEGLVRKKVVWHYQCSDCGKKFKKTY